MMAALPKTVSDPIDTIGNPKDVGWYDDKMTFHRVASAKAGQTVAVDIGICSLPIVMRYRCDPPEAFRKALQLQFDKYRIREDAKRARAEATRLKKEAKLKEQQERATA